MSDKLSEVHMVDNPMGSHNDEGGPPDIEANTMDNIVARCKRVLNGGGCAATGVPTVGSWTLNVVPGLQPGGMVTKPS